MLEKEAQQPTRHIQWICLSVPALLLSSKRLKGSDSSLPHFCSQQKMCHPCVTDTQNMLELRVSIPIVFVDRGWVDEADSNLICNTHKLTAFKDVKDKTNMVMAWKNQHIHGETHNKSSYPSWWRSRSRNSLLTFLCMMMRNSLKKSQVLLHLTVEYQKMCHRLFCAHSHASCH